MLVEFKASFKQEAGTLLLQLNLVPLEVFTPSLSLLYWPLQRIPRSCYLPVISGNAGGQSLSSLGAFRQLFGWEISGDQVYIRCAHLSGSRYFSVEAE